MKIKWYFVSLLYLVTTLFSGCSRKKTLEELAMEKQASILKEDIDFLRRNYGILMAKPDDLVTVLQRKMAIADAAPWLAANLVDTTDFLNYVLPYMVNDAIDQNWRSQAKARFADMNFPKGNIKMETFLQFCNQVADSIKKEMTFGTVDINESQLSYLALREYGRGSCVSMSDFTNYTFRAIGIPVTTDFIPAWGNLNAAGHAWNRLLLKGKSFPFMGAESNIGDYNPLVLSIKSDGSISTKRLPSKVYRISRYAGGNLDFFGKNVLDVTDEYLPVNTVIIQRSGRKDMPIYLATYNRGKYIISAIGKNDGSAVGFSKMATGLLYFPVRLDRATPVPVEHPVICRLHFNETKMANFQKTVSIKLDHLLPLAQGQMDYLAKNGYDGLDKIDFNNKYDICPVPVDKSAYELFYWDMGWKKHSVTYPKTKKLVFNKVPSNAVYMVKALGDSFDKMRPFTFENGLVEWF